MAAPSDHERRLAHQGVRKSLGAYYTPPDVVGGVLDLALEPLLAERAAIGHEAVAALRVIDPACGTGNFLVAVAHRITSTLVALGVDAAEAADAGVRCVHGIEVEASTAETCRASLSTLSPSFADEQVVRGDALLDAATASEGRYDLVVGNPPFLSRLGSKTARSVSEAKALRNRFGDAVAAYTDPATIFLALGHRLARPDGGVFALIEPISILSARDAAGVRRAVVADAALTDLWVIGNGVFDAAVEVCAPVLVRGASGDRTRLFAGRTRVPCPVVASPRPDEASWSRLLAAQGGLPVRSLQAQGTLAELATATADFRDQYYGLAPHVVDRASEAPGWPRLVTVGLIDPAALGWGHRLTRFNKASYLHPRVDLGALDPKLAAWAASRLVPKVLLATQTRVLEAVVDAEGSLLPSVPVISVVAPLADLWRVGAVLTCPAVALEASRRHLGSGRNARSMRLRAQEVLELPLPADREAWDEAADLLERGAPLVEVGRRMDEAYGLGDDDELLAWWIDLLP